MPYLTLRIAGVTPRETVTALVRRLTDLTAGVLGKEPALTAVTVEQVPPALWFIGGKPLPVDRSSFYLEVNVSEGTNTKGEKASFVAQAFATATALLGSLDPASYVVVHEVRADAYGYAGATQEFRYIEKQRLPVKHLAQVGGL